MRTSMQQLAWIRSSRCGSTTCAEFASDSRAAYLRDAKDPNGPWLEFSHEAWRTLIADIRDNHLDRST